MKPEKNAQRVLAITRSKAKMYEYDLPEREHIKIEQDLTTLLDITIGLLGDYANDHVNEISQLESPLFSAQYFDALHNSRLTSDYDIYLRLLGASAYYLSGYPGSSSVLAREINDINLEASGLELLLLSILKKKVILLPKTYEDSPYFELINRAGYYLKRFYIAGSNVKEIMPVLREIRSLSYEIGATRELLFSDVICAITSKQLETSLWTSLPKYSQIPKDSWESFIMANKNVKELWPAQMLIAEHGILTGVSAIIQVPTSAGKTKAIELVIRSAFLSKRTTVAVIVAPFRALCHEIAENMREHFQDMKDVNVNLVSDVLQDDLEVSKDGKYQLLVLTPEKLDFLLRHEPLLPASIGLIVYDEGHLFNDWFRGPKYELLLSSLKRSLLEMTQVILISAIIPNPEDVCEWLIGEKGAVVQARTLYPTSRTVAFVSWKDDLGRLEFVKEDDIDQEEYFVPWLLKQQVLNKQGKEKKDRIFPAQDQRGLYNPAHIALLLGCRLANKGGVAIFAGRKDSVRIMAENIVDAIKRGLSVPLPFESADEEELKRLIIYTKRIYGEESAYANAAELGIFVHHGNTPTGMRLSVEYALQEQKINFVICTSTLAQGVNLPIRYLIVTSNRQGGEPINTRDFHNLMGRAGRAGIFTEGNIIFSDHKIFDLKNNQYESWRWNNTRELMDIGLAKKCRSHILSLLEEPPFDEVKLKHWMNNKEKILDDIRSFILNESIDVVEEGIEEFINEILINTLAFYQADTAQKNALKEIFMTLTREVFAKVSSPEQRRIFAKSCIGLDETIEIMNHFMKEKDVLLAGLDTIEAAFESLWPILYKYNQKLPETISEEKLKAVCIAWCNGKSFLELFDDCSNEKFNNRKVTIDQVIDLCDNGFGFEGSMIVGTCINIIQDVVNDEDLLSILYILQKKLKYGLSDRVAIMLFELGFSDRSLAIELSQEVNSEIFSYVKEELVNVLTSQEIFLKEKIFRNYPLYFENLLNGIVRK